MKQLWPYNRYKKNIYVPRVIKYDSEVEEKEQPEWSTCILRILVNENGATLLLKDSLSATSVPRAENDQNQFKNIYWTYSL